MGILANITARLRGVKRQEFIRYATPGLFRFLPEGLRLTLDQQVSVSATYGAIRAIVDPLAASDWEVYVTEGAQRTNLRDGEVFYRLNLRANRNVPAIAAKELIITSALLHGDGYALVLRDNSGRVIGWDPLDSSRMRKSWRNDPSAIGGGTIVYEYIAETGAIYEVPDTDVIHLRGPSVASIFGGDSILARATVAIATAAAQEKFGNVYFANGAHLGGYLQLKGRLKTQADVDRLKADWNAKTAGLHKVGETAVLEDGAEFHSLTPDAERVQLVAPRAFQVEEIARYFGVPLVKLMVKEAASGYGSNLSTLNEQFSRDTLTPWAKRIAQEFGFKLLPQRSPWAEISVDLRWTTRGDAESRARVRQMDVQSGVITRDEARAEEGLSALPGGVGAIVTVAAGLMELTRENLAPKPPAPPPGPPQPEPEDQADKGPPEVEVENLVRAGVVLALDNHAKRWRARTRDVPEDKVHAAREELRARLAHDLGAFGERITDEQFAALATQVEAGFEPAKAADHVLAREAA